jgi:hypothetical protein
MAKYMEVYPLKRGNDQAKKPARSRGYRVEAGSKAKTSVGEALRKAKKDLVNRRIIGILFIILLVVAIIAIAYGGYFGKLIQYLIDRLL